MNGCFCNHIDEVDVLVEICDGLERCFSSCSSADTAPYPPTLPARVETSLASQEKTNLEEASSPPSLWFEQAIRVTSDDNVQWYPKDDLCMLEVVCQAAPDTSRPEPPLENRAIITMKDHVLRGVRSNTVLWWRANLLRSSKRSPAAFRLSQPVDHLGTFISHNWTASRDKKWMTLSLHYNLPTALIGSLLVVTIMAVVTSQDVLPLARVDNVWRQYEGVYCRVSGFLAFNVLLFFGHLLPDSCTWHHDVFLDKACVHQVNEELRREAMDALGGFLYYSWRFVVLYTRLYTQKMWTVYEMVCFLCVHPEGRLDWLPINLPPMVLLGSLSMWIASIMWWASSLTVVRAVFVAEEYLLYIISFPFLVVVTCIFRNVALDQAQSCHDLSHFSIRNAPCTIEGDRARVEGNVASLMRSLKRVPPDCTLNDAISSFDLLIQSTMPEVIRSSVGPAGLRYEYVATLLLTYVFQMFDIVSSHVLAGDSTRIVFAVIIEWSTLSLASLPLVFALCMSLCRQCESLTGMNHLIFVVLVAAVALLLAVFLYLAGRQLRLGARDDTAIFVMLCLVSFGLFMLTFGVYYRRQGVQHKRRAGLVSESIEDVAEAFSKVTKKKSVARARRSRSTATRGER